MRRQFLEGRTAPLSKRRSLWQLHSDHKRRHIAEPDASPGVGVWQIVLKKSFFADDRKFSGPLVRLSRCEVRDHINYRKNDRWPSYRFYRALQRLKSPTHDICEIFGAPRFSSFSTQSAKSGQLAQRELRALTRRIAACVVQYTCTLMA
jgi:hypothetical protein